MTSTGQPAARWDRAPDRGPQEPSQRQAATSGQAATADQVGMSGQAAPAMPNGATNAVNGNATTNTAGMPTVSNAVPHSGPHAGPNSRPHAGPNSAPSAAVGSGPWPSADAGPTAPAEVPRLDTALAELLVTAQRISANIERVLVGKPEVVRIALVTLLAEGHLLVEDVPGVGKTSLAKALARSIDCTGSRIQFTPDLLPSDITGVSIYNRQTMDFEFRPGPVFANIVVGDEINRASPKTQSALLECMEERHVTVDGVGYPLDSPFMVIATQNPIEMEGTYPLPEAQRDRFTARVSIGYPDPQAELAMVDEHAGADPISLLQPVSNAAQVQGLVAAVRRVHLAPEIRRYAVDLVSSTRRLPELRLGASPRSTLHLVRAARAQAALSGRDFVVPDDVHAVAIAVLAHRLVLSAEAQAARRSPTDLVRSLLQRVPVPMPHGVDRSADRSADRGGDRGPEHGADRSGQRNLSQR